MSELTLPAFQAALNTPFRVGLPTEAEVDLTLVEARTARSTSGGESFSLLFRGPVDPFLPQRMYAFSHEALGSFDLFIVPVGRDPEGFQYEAVFNR